MTYRCVLDALVQSLGAKTCARKSKKHGILKPMIFMGSRRITGPGVAFECEAQDGMHFNEDLWYPEIIDPRNRRAASRW